LCGYSDCNDNLRSKDHCKLTDYVEHFIRFGAQKGVMIDLPCVGCVRSSLHRLSTPPRQLRERLLPLDTPNLLIHKRRGDKQWPLPFPQGHACPVPASRHPIQTPTLAASGWVRPTRRARNPRVGKTQWVQLVPVSTIPKRQSPIAQRSAWRFCFGAAWST
jgi:hypothetical protein